MKSKRNGLLELYRIILCFWVMQHHDFFFLLNTSSKFSVAQLSVDFFFVISGFFLIRSMRRKQDGQVLKNTWRVMFEKLKPLLFTMLFITAFNLICMVLFIRENAFEVLFQIFRYWWYVLYLVIAVGIFYLLYRLVKKEKLFAIVVAVITVLMGIFHYALDQKGFFIYEFTFVARTFGCMGLGILLSYIPNWKTKKFNINIIFVIILIPILLYMAYAKKSYLTCLVMLGLFCALVHFTSNIQVGGKVFDIIGELSTRMYLYMSFVSMLDVLGLSNHRILFVIDVALSTLDLFVKTYKEKYKKLEKQTKQKRSV